MATLAGSAAAWRADSSVSPAQRGATFSNSAFAPRRRNCSTASAPDISGRDDALGITTNRASEPPAKSTSRWRTASLSERTAPPIGITVPATGWKASACAVSAA
ncbi:hypothetical protein [Pseudoduganella sp. UC29_71]|uniref:hypothetical protein n=1 Tax=Pseudoduganella sp. UC29_71 TaxID=3350174 RepID=UPI00366E105E